MVGRATGRKTGMMTGLGPLQKNSGVNGTMMRFLSGVCGVAGSNPNPQQQNNEKVKVMIGSGSQSTAFGVNFAKTVRRTIRRGKTVGHPGSEN